MDNNPIPIFASCGFVAHLAGVSPQTVRNYVKLGLIKPSARVCQLGDDRGAAAVFSGPDLNGVVENIKRIVSFERSNPQIFGNDPVNTGKIVADQLAPK